MYFINDEIQKKLNDNILNIISRLNLFFSERKEGIKEFKEKINVIKLQLLKLSSQTWEIDTKENLEKLSKLLDSRNINDLLKEKNYDEIKKEINNDIKQNLLELKKPIINYINNKISNINLLVKEATSIVINFYQDKTIFNKISFKEYYIKYFGDENKKDLTGEIYNYIINSSESLLYILFNNGFVELIKSIFSSNYYLINLINLIKNNYSNCIRKVLTKFSNVTKDYIEEIVNSIDFILLNININYNKEQKTKWSNLKLLYEKKKEEILKENENIKKILEVNKEMIEKEKDKNDK